MKISLENVTLTVSRKLLLSLTALSSLSVAVPSYAESDNQCTVANGCAAVTDHDAYWVAKIRPSGSLFRISIINDTHVNTKTNRVTVYAQSRLFSKVVAPAQLSPGECETRSDGKVCSHPDAVYLDGTGNELAKDNGKGSWWVKHSWVLDGEGYDNSELKPMENYPSFYVEGKLLEDGITMKIGNPEWGYNLRWPIYGQNGEDVSYKVQRFNAVKQDDGTFKSEKGFELDWKCTNEASPFDGKKRGCPKTKE
ncbi:hypothetical protein A165_15155 [Vibrio tasmaniensis ZS-17]|uniref:hypothetical protein n=1 Tax=Vibrio tasmaniensis TaxID=212663 RepID=UPI00031F3463|nr:hypothetical protein [Vibrio tasmaniensis]OED62881.1 hypothetical protein A165_15155 [Vibrio tasmaniensis ZS-17]